MESELTGANSSATAVTAMFETLPHDNPLWTLISMWTPRLAAAMNALNALPALKAVVASL